MLHNMRTLPGSSYNSKVMVISRNMAVRRVGGGGVRFAWRFQAVVIFKTLILVLMFNTNAEMCL